MLLIKPCNISPRLLFVPGRRLMSLTLSQQETKTQRTHCSLRGQQRFWTMRRRLHWGETEKSNYPPLPIFRINLTWMTLNFIHSCWDSLCSSVGQLCCHQERDLDKRHHHPLTEWETVPGQTKHSSRAAAVVHHTCDDCWITKHPLESKNNKYNSAFNAIKFNCFILSGCLGNWELKKGPILLISMY